MTLPSAKQRIVDCYFATCCGYSADRVVVDPALNAPFLAACRSKGCTGTDAELNRTLLNIRKAGHFRGLNAQTTRFNDLDQYLFGAEIAIRVLERRTSLSLDSILCNPALAAEFDLIAADVAPGFDVVKYRWAALHLRKSRQLRPELVAHVSPPESISVVRVIDMRLGDVPARQGVYIFHNRNETLYVGEAVNLRNRIGKHLDHSDNKLLARWIWEAGVEDVFLELQVLRDDTTTRIRKALESELIASRSPAFNIRP